MVGRLFARMHSVEREPPAIGTTLQPVTEEPFGGLTKSSAAVVPN
jgi:hypothetical protein